MARRDSGFTVTKRRRLPKKIVCAGLVAIKLATLFLSRNHRLGITGIPLITITSELPFQFPKLLQTNVITLRLILSFFSTESAFKVLGAAQTAAITRDVKKNAVPAKRSSRFYPGRNHDCSRRDCVAGRARAARDASGAETRTSYAE